LVSSSNEVSLDVDVGVGNQAKVLVLFAVEVEGYAVTADESRVLTDRAWSVTT